MRYKITVIKDSNMPQHIEIFIRKFINSFSRSRLLIKVLGLSKSEQNQDQKGLIIIQVDALSRKQIEKAIQKKEVPFISNLLNKQHYKLHSHYTGMPCSTAAVQAELFYGVKSAVPAFSFYDYKTKRVFIMFNPRDALEIENRLRQTGNRPLLTNGSAYSDIYTGGAEESHFCISSLGIKGFFRNRHPLGFILLTILHFYSLIRTSVLFFIEICLAIIDVFRGLIKGKDLLKELKFIPSRVALCIVMRELIVIGTKIDIARGMPIIHLNFMGYHEQSHRRGGTSKFAHWTLRGIDDAIKRIWIAAHKSSVRDYNVWIYSDHGQIDTVPYEKEFGKSIQQAVKETFNKTHLTSQSGSTKEIGFLARAGLRKPKFFDRIFISNQNLDSDKLIITALGPMGHIYLKDKLDENEIQKFAVNLIKKQHVPMVFITNKNSKNDKVQVLTEDGHFILPNQAEKIFNTDTLFYNENVKDFIDSCKKENCGDILINGLSINKNLCYTFAMENGSHGGIDSEETEGFALLPGNTFGINSEKSYLRPMDLRNAALGIIDGESQKIETLHSDPKEIKKTLRIMTYNVHGCIGMDGKLSPRRIADVISQYEPDIVTLQELDVGRKRSGNEDQALIIANHLNMEHHFNAALELAEESFGDAILSSLPMQLIKKAPLSRNEKFSHLETRGALWVQVILNDKSIQIINTHLGLNAKERMIHAKELLGENWIGYPDCRSPFMLCGDFNALPAAKVFKYINNNISSVQTKINKKRHSYTWFGRYPLICLDHIFISQDFDVVNVEVGDSYLARIASDHRPIIAELKIK